MTAHDGFEWTNGIVGGLGLLVTFCGALLAKGARSAARDARKAVFRRNSAEDLLRVRDIARDFSSAVQTERDELALHLATSFVATCSSARERHRDFLGTDGGKLELATEVLNSASVSLQQDSKSNRSNVFADAQRVVRIVSSVSGVLDRDNEKESQ